MHETELNIEHSWWSKSQPNEFYGDFDDSQQEIKKGFLKSKKKMFSFRKIISNPNEKSERNRHLLLTFSYISHSFPTDAMITWMKSLQT